MRKKLIYLISFVVVLSLASITYGDGIVIGNFENPADPNHDGWIIADGNVTTSYSSPTGVTLGSYNLRINSPIVGTTGGFRQVLNYSLIENGKVDEFRRNLKVSLDVTRLYDDWVPQELFTGEWSEFLLIVQAGSASGTPWTFGAQLSPDASWSRADGSDPMSVTYDYSLALNQIDFNNLEYLVLTIATNWGYYDSDGVYYLDNVKLVGEGAAYDPNPADHATDVQSVPNFSWTPGAYADKHDVYFGTSFNDVNDANRASHPGLLHYKENHDSNYYDPGTLELYTTYYWRIDEVNGPNIWKGAVWDFMTVYPGMGVVIGDWEEGMNGWEAAWQGDTTFSYSTTGVTLGNYSLGVQTVKKGPEDPAYWILQRWGPLLDLTNMKLQLDVTIIASEWTDQEIWVGPLVVQSDLPGLGGWREFSTTAINRNTGGMAPTNWKPIWGDAYRTYTFDFSGYSDWADAKRIRILLALQNPAEGPGNFYVDNARLFDVRLASNPRPANGATDVNKTPTLGWTKGKDATSHDVYFGTNETAMTNANTSSPEFKGNRTQTTYGPVGPLEKDKTYYWRIDERGAPGSPWKGLVWHFTTASYSIVDDFEGYNNTSKIIQNTWIKGGGGNVGYSDPDYAEVTIVHGGKQSMPFKYINDGSTGKEFYSETFRQWDEPQDWATEDFKTLSLWFRGYPATEGSYNAANNTFTLISDGADIWGTADDFHFVYKELTGDADILAKVVSLENTGDWAKAGVMIRDSLDADSAHALMSVTPSGRRAFQNRSVYKGASLTAHSDEGRITTPHWVRLIREPGIPNDVITAYHSYDGINWEKQPDSEYTGDDASMNPAGVVMTDPVYIGLAYSSYATGTFGQAVFSNVSIDGSVSGDWQSEDVPNNDAEQLYIVIEDVTDANTIVKHPDPNAVLLDKWTEWPIYLQDIADASVDTKNIKRMYIGVGDRENPVSGGTGKLYIDDIRLYLPRCMPNLKPDLTGDCFIDYDDLQILTSDWLSSPADPNIDLYEDDKIDLKDYAVLASKWLEKLLWP